MSERASHIEQFLASHLDAYTQHPLAGDASFRRYIRVNTPKGSFMLMDAPPGKEDVRPFMKVSRMLAAGGFSAPLIIAADEAKGFLLLEDLGDDTFSRLLKQDAAGEEEFYRAAVALLAHWHAGAIADVADLAPYDTPTLMREVKLLSDWFLPQIMDGEALAGAQKSYEALWLELIEKAPLATDQFVHRDYHADNLMWLGAREGVSRVGLLDYQDALAGDAAYDLVSLLEDARRDVAPEFAESLIRYYLAESKAEEARLRHAYALLAAQRNAKIVGIFTRLAARDGKTHYLHFLPRVWNYLIRDAGHPALAPLKAWLDRYVPATARGEVAIRKNAKMLGLAA